MPFGLLAAVSFGTDLRRIAQNLCVCLKKNKKKQKENETILASAIFFDQLTKFLEESMAFKAPMKTRPSLISTRTHLFNNSSMASQPSGRGGSRRLRSGWKKDVSRDIIEWIKKKTTHGKRSTQTQKTKS
jgi:hypothetical protein